MIITARYPRDSIRSTGNWQLATGNWQLATGNWQLDMLLWRSGALGDTLLLLPALAALRQAFPRRRIVAVGNPAALAPATWQGLVDDIFDAGDLRLAPLLMGEPPAPSVLPKGLGTAVVWSGRSDIIGRGLERAGLTRVITAPILPHEPLPMAWYYLSTLAPLLAAAGMQSLPLGRNVSGSARRPPRAPILPRSFHALAVPSPALPLSYTLAAPLSARLATDAVWAALCRDAGTGREWERRVVFLHPGAGSRLKRWPLDRYLMLARMLRAGGLVAAWTVGPDEEELRAVLRDAGEEAAIVPPLDVARLAAVLERAAVCVSADCGIAHLAALLGVPVVALFGPTDDAVWAPPGPHSTTLRLELPCAPCAPSGDMTVMRACPSRLCLRALPVRPVYEAVRALL